MKECALPDAAFLFHLKLLKCFKYNAITIKDIIITESHLQLQKLATTLQMAYTIKLLKIDFQK